MGEYPDGTQEERTPGNSTGGGGGGDECHASCTSDPTSCGTFNAFIAPGGCAETCPLALLVEGMAMLCHVVHGAASRWPCCYSANPSCLPPTLMWSRRADKRPGSATFLGVSIATVPGCPLGSATFALDAVPEDADRIDFEAGFRESVAALHANVTSTDVTVLGITSGSIVVRCGPRL